MLDATFEDLDHQTHTRLRRSLDAINKSNMNCLKHVEKKDKNPNGTVTKSTKTLNKPKT